MEKEWDERKPLMHSEIHCAVCQLGHITYTALAAPHTAQSSRNIQGNLLMDAPPHVKLDDLIHLAMDRVAWSSSSSMVRHIPVQIPTRHQQKCVLRRSRRCNLSLVNYEKCVTLTHSAQPARNIKRRRFWDMSRINSIYLLFYLF